MIIILQKRIKRHHSINNIYYFYIEKRRIIKMKVEKPELRVLIIENDEYVVRSISKDSIYAGCPSVTVSKTLFDAREKISDPKNGYDLIIMDREMKFSNDTPTISEEFALTFLHTLEFWHISTPVLIYSRAKPIDFITYRKYVTGNFSNVVDVVLFNGGSELQFEENTETSKNISALSKDEFVTVVSSIIKKDWIKKGN